MRRTKLQGRSYVPRRARELSVSWVLEGGRTELQARGKRQAVFSLRRHVLVRMTIVNMSINSLEPSLEP